MSEPLVVVKGSPDDEELAALVTALAMVSARAAQQRAAAALAGGPAQGRQSRWRSGRFGLRHGPLPRGAGAWQSVLL